MKVNDIVIVRTTQGKQSVKVLATYHPDFEGNYILNDVVTVKHLNGEIAKYYLKHLTQA
ncbi:hypothetical protein LCGC14_2484390 [marine sediment metagenome]|uniref:Uncharacterized protein n=1 Tax=marine sediment metagenome TaxID=412755 RepID=A0A0F9DIK0_9ZZZZ